MDLNRKTTIQYYNITLLTRTCPRINATFAPEPFEVVPGRISLTPGPCITTTVHTASQAYTQYTSMFLFESSYRTGFFIEKLSYCVHLHSIPSNDVISEENYTQSFKDRRHKNISHTRK